jgi:hypothetical protein
MEEELIILGIETKITMLLEQLLNDKKVTTQFSLVKLDELHTLAELYARIKFGVQNVKK